MAAVKKTPNPALSIDYDAEADVLYLALGKPRPAEGQDGPNGLVYRYAIDDNAPCGVTIIGLRRNQWDGKPAELARLIAGHFAVDAGRIRALLRQSSAAI